MTDGSPRQMTIQEGVSLQEHLQSKIDAMEKATTVAQTALERRLESMNEFRAAMSDLAARAVTRGELDLLRERINTLATAEELSALGKAMALEIAGLREWKSAVEGKASQQSVNVSMVLAIAGLLLGLLGLVSRWL